MDAPGIGDNDSVLGGRLTECHGTELVEVSSSSIDVVVDIRVVVGGNRLRLKVAIGVDVFVVVSSPGVASVVKAEVVSQEATRPSFVGDSVVVALSDVDVTGDGISTSEIGSLVVVVVAEVVVFIVIVIVVVIVVQSKSRCGKILVDTAKTLCYRFCTRAQVRSF